MRILFSISLILLYVIALLRPVAPYIEYVMMKDYIIENYCVNKDNPLLECNGLCHLGEQLKKVNDEEAPGDPKTTLKAEDFPYSILPVNNSTQDKIEETDDLNNAFKKSNYSYLFSETGFHPPEFA